LRPNPESRIVRDYKKGERMEVFAKNIESTLRILSKQINNLLKDFEDLKQAIDLKEQYIFKLEGEVNSLSNDNMRLRGEDPNQIR